MLWGRQGMRHNWHHCHNLISKAATLLLLSVLGGLSNQQPSCTCSQLREEHPDIKHSALLDPNTLDLWGKFPLNVSSVVKICSTAFLTHFLYSITPDVVGEQGLAFSSKADSSFYQTLSISSPLALLWKTLRINSRFWRQPVCPTRSSQTSPG